MKVLPPPPSKKNTYAKTKNPEELFRAACPQNETAPEKCSNRYEKRFENRKKGSEKRSETRLKNL